MRDNFKLLVFDWDGTLMDSEAQIVAAMTAAIDDLGLEPLPHRTISNIIGLGLYEAINTLLPGRDAQFHEQLTARYRHHFLGSQIAQAPLFDGAEQTLRILHAAGYMLAVATGKGRQGLNRVLTDTGLGELFHASRCADETSSKPHPQMLLEIMEQLDVATDETLMIGDTEYDLQMARNAGVGSIGVSYGVHDDARLLQLEPLALLHDIAELPRWLGVGQADVIA
jgi:phosphoglycolate phosphatase